MLFLSGKSKGAVPSFSSTPKQDPQELVKEWKKNINKEMRGVERNIMGIKREEDKSLRECKLLIKKGHQDQAKILAKEIINARKAIERLYVSRAQLNSVSMQLQRAASLAKMQGSIVKSTEVLQSMNKLIGVKEVSESMRNLAREMEKAGLIEEIMTDTLASMDDEGIEDAADEEVNKIVTELTSGILNKAGSVPSKSIATNKVEKVEEQTEEEQVNIDTDELLKRLQAL